MGTIAARIAMIQGNLIFHSVGALQVVLCACPSFEMHGAVGLDCLQVTANIVAWITNH